MKVRIIKLPKKFYWYSDLKYLNTIHEVEYRDAMGRFYLTDTPWNWIEESDCIVIDEVSGVKKPQQKTDEGDKFDGDKIRTDLLSVPAMMGTSKVLTFGAKRYGDRNWEKGLSFSRVFGACLRHLFSWWMKIDNDEESGINHLHHAACCIMFLQHYVETKTGKDDRP